MSRVRVEVLAEPFREGAPGPHVQAVVDAFIAAGLTPDMGPFATSADGDLDNVAGAVGAVITAAVAAGATAVQIRVEPA